MRGRYRIGRCSILFAERRRQELRQFRWRSTPPTERGRKGRRKGHVWLF